MSVKPRFRSPHVAGRRSRAAAIGKVAESHLGFSLMPWQKDVLKGATQYDPQKEDRPFYKQITVTVPRQSGKTFLLYAVMVEQALREPFSKIVYTAQTRLNAARRVLDLGGLMVRAGVKVKITRGIGNEKIEFPNGSVIEVMSPVEKGFHGDSIGGPAVLDEVWAVDEIVMQGLIPATAARPNAQTFAISTMGTPESELLNRFVTQGRESVADAREEGHFYVEYSADPDLDPFAPGTWRSFHPALGLTVDEESIESAKEILLPGDFVRAYTNQMVDSLDAAVPWDLWESGYRSNVPIPNADLTLAVDVGIGGEAASLAVAWATEEESTHFELVEQRYGNLEWLSRSVQNYLDQRPIGMVVIDAVGPARAFATELEAICLRRGLTLITPKSMEIASACAVFFDLLRQGKATHGSAPPLDEAIRGVVLKTVGDQWVWSRRQSRFDVSPLYASTLAVWSIHNQRVAPKPVLSVW